MLSAVSLKVDLATPKLRLPQSVKTAQTDAGQNYPYKSFS